MTQLQALKEQKEQLEAKKAELLKLKSDDKLTDKQQEQLNDIAVKLVDLDEEIEKALSNGSSYEVPKGTENHVHLNIVRGNRFSAKTGKEINPPYVQIFSRGEFEVFKQSFKNLGYTIVSVLHDPTGEASSLISKD
nr:MAG TPA: hypothetical protein [Caudoviricetes sp.]